MRIALIIDTWFPIFGGGQVNAYEISKRLAKNDIKIDIITRDNGKENFKLPKNLKVIKIGPRSKPNNKLSQMYFLFSAFFFLQKHKYDIIHAHAFLPGIIARLISVFKGIPTVFTVHGTSIQTNLQNPISRMIEKFILTEIFYNKQITVSQDFLKIENVNKNPLYIPNGVNTKEFDLVKTKKNKNQTLLFVGRLHPQKNLTTLLKSMSHVVKKYPKVKLVIVGEGELKSQLKKTTKTLNLSKNIVFKGKINGKNLVKIYKSSHILILPSVYEGQPLVMLEAWAAKIPVIVPNAGDCPYLVKEGRNGYLIKNTNNPIEIAKIIKKSIKSEKLKEMGTNGYNFVKSTFTWEIAAKKTMAVYKSLHNG